MRLFLIISLLGIICCSCSQNKIIEDEKISPNQIKYAENFKVFQKKSYIEIHILQPETKRIEKIIKYFTNHRLTSNTKPNVIQIHRPIDRIACLSSTYIGMLNKINSLNKIKCIDNEKYISNQQLLNRVKNKQIETVGSIENIKLEQLLSARVSFIFYSGFEVKLPIINKLERLGIQPIPTYEWKESSPLGKAEWIKLFGILTNQSQLANKYFQDIEQKYNQLKAKAHQYQLSKKLLSGSLIGDSWFLPAGESYMGVLFNDAKIDYVAKNTKGTGSISMGLENCLKNYQTSPIWINVGAKNKRELLQFNEKYRLFNAFKTNQLYCYSTNPNLFWENSIIEPHRLLNDLLIISHPKEYKGNLYFYRKLNE